MKPRHCLLKQWVACIVVATVLCLNVAAARFARGQSDSPEPNQTIRVLTIGNSFAQNACRYLQEIAADGSADLVIGTANLGGCTLERHARLARESADDSSVRPYSRKTAAGSTNLSLKEYLEVEPWDFVTLQQMSALSWQPETYHPHIEELVALIHKHAPQAKILIHETWAYRPDAPYLQEHSLTQDEMYERLSNAYDNVATQFDARVIPVGTAFQQVRSTPGRNVVVPDPNYDFDNPVFPQRPDQSNSLVTGWWWDGRGDEKTLRLDFKHGNTAGCYLAGLVWYETITGNDAREIDYAPRGIEDADARFFRETAHAVAGR